MVTQSHRSHKKIHLQSGICGTTYCSRGATLDIKQWKSTGINLARVSIQSHMNSGVVGGSEIYGLINLNKHKCLHNYLRRLASIYEQTRIRHAGHNMRTIG